MKIKFMPVLADEKIFAENYRLPSPELFTKPERVDDISDKDIIETCEKIKSCFDSFNVKATIVGVDVGPRVARYIIKPDKNTKIKSILDLIPDLHLYTYAKGVRGVAPLEGTGNVGLEIDRETGRHVRYREAIESPEFSGNKSLTAVCLGVDVTGKAVVVDLDRMNGLLIGGCTGSGKSILIDNIIANILCKAHPHEFKLALIDPKQVEFTRYKRLPHLYAPVANDTEDTMNILGSLLDEVKRRLEILESAGKSFREYNASAEEKLPHIAVIADEITDFMLSGIKNKFVKALVELVSAGSQFGIHVIIATQRADRSILTKELRDAFRSRACLHLATYQDSRLVLECLGAERLLFRGDMLFRGMPNVQEPKRIQVPFIGDKEINALIEYVKAETAKCNSFGSPEGEYAPDDSYTASAHEDKKARMILEIEAENYSNDYAAAMAEKFNLVDASILPHLVEAMDIAVDQGMVSTALLQRRMGIGFGKAARILDYMENMGFVSEKEGAKPRNLLISEDEWDSISEIVKRKYHLDEKKDLDDTSDEIIDIAKLFDLRDETIDEPDETIDEPDETIDEPDETIDEPDDEIGDDSEEAGDDPYSEMPDTAAISAALAKKLEGFGPDGFVDFMKAIEVAVSKGQVSTALLQRKMNIGFGKAARFIDYMEELKIVTPKEGAKPRTVLITHEELKFIIRSIWK